MILIHPNSPTPIYEQLYEGIKKLIETKELKKGEHLPSIRNLSKQLDIANNTVARVYQMLEKDGYLESNGRKGTFVKNIQTDQNSVQIFKEPIRNLMLQGLEKEEIEHIFGKTLDLFFN
jgi:DNA-binding transcriptional regulator YhcF (GntR family)